MVIHGMEQLKVTVEEDLVKKSARHIRFINVERMDVWVEVKDFIAGLCSRDNHVLLSKYCSDVDLTPKTMRLIADLKKISANTIVLPLSEHIRINNSVADQLLNNIINLDYAMGNADDEFRVYFPMYRMKSTLEKILKHDPRLEGSIWFLDLAECDDDYSLTILPKVYTTKIRGNNLEGYKSYLSYWESNPCKPIILHTDNAVYYRNNVYNDNVTVLITAYDILQYHKIVDISIEEAYGAERDWSAVLRGIDNQTNLTGYLKKYFGLNVFNIDELIGRFYKEKTDFGKWLTWLWLKLENCTPYLKHVLSNSNKWPELIPMVINSIFDFSVTATNYWSIYNERKDLMNKLQVKILPSPFWDKWSALPANKDICYLSDTTANERSEIISNSNEIFKLKGGEDILKRIYPDLFAYLSVHSSGFLQIDDYFMEYRKNKITNSFSDSFVEKVNSIGNEKGIWWKLGMKSRNSIVDEVYNKDTYIFYLDAFGAEFCPYIMYLLDKEHGSVYCDSKLGFAELPTITYCNKEFVSNRNSEPRIPDLDEVKHFGTYPSYISEELRIIRDTIDKAVSKLETYEKVIITSDHGASRGFVVAKGKSEKALNDAKVERNGRYCIDNIAIYEGNIPYCIDAGDYHVMTNYDRFSISGATKNENHGGATLEEVLVTVVILSRKPLFQKATIVDSDTNIKPSNGIAHVTFKFDIEVENVVAIVMGERYICLKENERYGFNVPIAGPTEYTAQVICNEQINEFRYIVQKGIKSKMDI